MVIIIRELQKNAFFPFLVKVKDLVDMAKAQQWDVHHKALKGRQKVYFPDQALLTFHCTEKVF